MNSEYSYDIILMKFQEVKLKLKELLIKNRSYRRFYQEEKVDIQDLKEMISNVRFIPSAANLQPLEFILVNNEIKNKSIFKNLKWAGYIEDWDGPEQGERPSSYIVVLGNREISSYIDWDFGIALQTILLSAVEMGYGGCTIASFNKDNIRNLFNIPENYDILPIIAIGKPKEKVVIEEIKDNDIKYWRDEDQVHHVPKRSLNDLIFISG